MSNNDKEYKPQKVKKPLNKKQKALVAVFLVLIFAAIVLVIYAADQLRQGNNEEIRIIIPKDLEMPEGLRDQLPDEIKVPMGTGSGDNP